ncbi:hypothetical protein P4O66_002469 [Electrophorus voltai]|uniref:Uncharacterized protein n=1 Tax=Electrophorus voltai TaxID=2609070 RepID=A0AAD8YZA9_9TELE|nr:hypothetical protein P4O66_002469 [Electrophorus voltai]
MDDLAKMQRASNTIRPKNSKLGRRVPSFHVSLLKSVISGPLNEVSPDDVPLQPIEYDGAPVYAVRCTLDSRRWGAPFNIWLTGRALALMATHRDILDPGFLSEFYVQFPDKPAPLPQGCPRRPLSGVSWPGSASSTPVGRRRHPRASVIPDSLGVGTVTPPNTRTKYNTHHAVSLQESDSSNHQFTRSTSPVY